MTVVLAAAARALAETPIDADDSMLLSVLGRIMVPSLCDVVALYAADASGTFRLMGAGPDDPALAPRIRASVEQAHGPGPEIAVPLIGDDQGEGLLVISATDPGRRYDADERAAADLLAAIVAARRTARRQADREAKLRQQMEAMVLAGRELAHLLNNDLTMPVGVIELLMDRDSTPPELQEMLQAAAHDLAALERHIRAYHEAMRQHASGLED